MPCHAMAHRAISNLSAYIGHKDPATHQILVAGDFNLIHEATEQNPLALPEWDKGVFALCNRSGSSSWDCNIRTEGWPLRHKGAFGRTRRTFRRTTPHTSNQARQQTSSTTYLCRGFHRNVRTHGLNEPEQWGPSDHCRIVIEVFPETFPAGEPAT